MSAETITPFNLDPSAAAQAATVGDGSGGGAGRGGGGNSLGSPLVVVQQPRNAAPPRPAPLRSRDDADNSLRNGYAAISHSVSGETAAIGIGFLLGGPIGAIIGGTIAPAAVAALMWRSRRTEHDANSNGPSTGNSSSDRSGARGDGARGNGARGNENGGGQNRNNASGGGRHKHPKGHHNGSGAGHHKKPKIKDPVADKLAKLGKDLGKKIKQSSGDKAGSGLKNSKNDKSNKVPKSPRPDTSSAGDDSKTPKDSNSRKWLKDRGPQPNSNRPWHDRGHKNKTEKPRKDKRDKNNTDDGTTSTTARDGLEPKKPNGGGGTEEEIFDAEIVDDGLPPKPDKAPDDVIDGEVIDEDRIALVRAKRERAQRRQAITAGKKAAQQAARDSDMGDPNQVKADVIREHNQRIDLELHHENHLLALAAAAEKPRSTPVNYPAIQAAPAGTRTAEVAIARQIDFRTSSAYALLRAMADQLAHGLHNDDAADMADHIIELTGIPNMCKNLSTAVQEAGRALARTAPLHPSVIKHLNNAAVAARSAGLMADNIMIVFVQAHREDIIRVLDPRIGEERWNLRNSPGTLDATKLRAAIASAHSQRFALPAGASSPNNTTGGSKLVPASDGSTKKLINLMKGFTRGHMVVVLSEIAGAAAGVEVVADSVTKLYRRMAKTWPTEGIVDDTVRATASKVRTVSVELRKAIKAAQRAHQRELRLNAKPRKGARAEKKWDVAGRRPSS
ncbi:hypothetical protein ACF1GW_38770 [Streptomyces achromogenes]|uniref:hypothetical protein n=1 Tax=Streptomyces achromogenes TaxID=67255 RepID=UPI0036FFC51B